MSTPPTPLPCKMQTPRRSSQRSFSRSTSIPQLDFGESPRNSPSNSWTPTETNMKSKDITGGISVPQRFNLSLDEDFISGQNQTASPEAQLAAVIQSVRQQQEEQEQAECSLIAAMREFAQRTIQSNVGLQRRVATLEALCSEQQTLLKHILHKEGCFSDENRTDLEMKTVDCPGKQPEMNANTSEIKDNQKLIETLIKLDIQVEQLRHDNASLRGQLRVL